MRCPVQQRPGPWIRVDLGELPALPLAYCVTSDKSLWLSDLVLGWSKVMVRQGYNTFHFPLVRSRRLVKCHFHCSVHGKGKALRSWGLRERQSQMVWQDIMNWKSFLSLPSKCWVTKLLLGMELRKAMIILCQRIYRKTTFFYLHVAYIFSSGQPFLPIFQSAGILLYPCFFQSPP